MQDAFTLIGRYVKLDRRGMACCPFGEHHHHGQDRHPSFRVYTPSTPGGNCGIAIPGARVATCLTSCACITASMLGPCGRAFSREKLSKETRYGKPTSDDFLWFH